MEFGKMLKELREKKGLTQAALAARAGMSLRTIQGWEQGRRQPVSANFFRLIGALGVSADEFVGMMLKAEKVKRPRKADR